MELYKSLFLWFSVSITAISGVIKTSGDPPPPVDVSEFPGYDPYRAYKAATALETEYEWFISAYDLPDPHHERTNIQFGTICFTYIRSKNSDDWVEYHRSDVVLKKVHSMYAKFGNKISLPPLRGQYSFKFELRSVSIDDANVLDNSHILGYAEAELEEIIRSPKTVLPLKQEAFENHSKDSYGYITILSEKLVNDFDLVYMKLAATIRNREPDQPQKLNPYVQIYRQTKDDDRVLVWKSRVFLDSSKPEWPRFTIPVKNLCNGDYKRLLTFVCMDFVEDGEDEYVGEFETSLNTMADYTNRRFSLKRWKNEEVGGIRMLDFDVVKLPSFSDYIKDGLRLQCTIAVDFADAHRELQRPSGDESAASHFTDLVDDLNTDRRMYEKALVSVATLIEDFDWDRKIVLLEYGRKKTSDELSDDNHSNSMECMGSQGVIDAYRKLLATGGFSEPTLLAPVIRGFTRAAKLSERREEYSILVILTGELISDLDETKKALEEVYDRLRAVIIILGIGDAKFEDVKKLIAENKFGADSHGGNVYFLEFSRLRAFNMRDIRLYLGRAFFLSSRDPLKSSF